MELLCVAKHITFVLKFQIQSFAEILIVKNLVLTYKMDLDIAMPSTGTTEPIRRPVRRGVTTTEDIVEELVSSILKATSPLLR
jgi:hypothetical protein